MISVLFLAEHAVQDLFVSVLYAAEVTAEAVLIQLLMGLAIPEAAGVGGDLVSQHKLTVGSCRIPA